MSEQNLLRIEEAKNLDLNIAICIKQVPNTDNIKFDWKKGVIIRTEENNIINPDDLNAIELGLEIKEKYGAKLTAITMGPPQARSALIEAYARGVDDAILISDPIFAGSDSLITSKILHRALNKLGHFDIIITGFQTLDGSTSQVSYQLAEFFNIPHLTNLKDGIDAIQIDVNNNIYVKRLYGHEFQHVKAKLPVLIAAKRETNIVRHPRLVDIKNAFKKKITQLTLDDIGGSADEYGLKASPTITIEGNIFKQERKRERFEGSVDEQINKLVQKLKKYRIIRI
ncbi:MAG: electron transfer flavoprotein subunit beta/FixA family protein [Promethearchaeota archaeon]